MILGSRPWRAMTVRQISHDDAVGETNEIGASRNMELGRGSLTLNGRLHLHDWEIAALTLAN